MLGVAGTVMATRSSLLSCSPSSLSSSPVLDCADEGQPIQPLLIVIIFLSICVVVLLVILSIAAFVYRCCRSPSAVEEQRVDDPEFTFHKPPLKQATNEAGRRTLLLPKTKIGKAFERFQASTARRFGKIRKGIPRNELSPEQRIQVLEYSHGSVCLLGDIGQSNFGMVYKGEALGLCLGKEEDEETSDTVLVKSLRETSSDIVRQLFHLEMVWASSFEHPNVLQLMAVCTSEEPKYLLYEYLEFGTLREFLLSTEAVWVDFESAVGTDTSSTIPQPEQELVGVDELVNIAVQVAEGMQYLASKGFVHKDLAARNCHVGQGLQVKIANFGLSYDPESVDYCHIQSKSSHPLPLRWMAPESLKHKQFSTYSDIWSYGVLLWEVFSFGAQPYSGFSNAQAVQKIATSQLLRKTEHCPSKIFHIMLQCWQKRPEQRISFTTIKEKLESCSVLVGEENMLSKRMSLVSLRIPATPDLARSLQT